jgi:hypothetical protein
MEISADVEHITGYVRRFWLQAKHKKISRKAAIMKKIIINVSLLIYSSAFDWRLFVKLFADFLAKPQKIKINASQLIYSSVFDWPLCVKLFAEIHAKPQR